MPAPGGTGDCELGDLIWTWSASPQEEQWGFLITPLQGRFCFFPFYLIICVFPFSASKCADYVPHIEFEIDILYLKK